MLNVVRWSGSLPAASGRVVEIQFALYQDQAGGTPLWRETQTVMVAADGRYSVLLGAASPEGLPQLLFQAGEARWIEARPVTASGGPNKSDSELAPVRNLLAAVPYALKAVDSETLAGRAADDYVTREDLQSAVAADVQATQVVRPDLTPTGSGVANTIPLWTSASNLGDSALTQLGTASAPLVGVNNAAPATTLDVVGTTTLRGITALTPTTVANATTGVSSPLLSMNASSFQSGAAAVNEKFGWEAQPTGNNTASPGAQLSLIFAAGAGSNTNTGLYFLSNGSIVSHSSIEAGGAAATPSLGGASPSFILGGAAYNSSTSASVPQTFALKTAPVGNDTPTPSANLELLFGAGSSPVTATGLSFGPNGVITFVPSQTFPGAGTITGVTATSLLSGGGTSGNVSLGLNLPQLENTLNGVYPSLAGSNVFTGASNTFTGPVTFAAGQTFPGTGAGTITRVSAGTGLTGGGLSGPVTLAVDATKVPLLDASLNRFIGAIATSGISATNGINSIGGNVGFTGSFQPGSIVIPPGGVATPTTTFNSSIDIISGAYSSLDGSQARDIAWVNKIDGNNTNNPEPELDLVYDYLGSNTVPVLSINASGVITFAAGQTFPGAGGITGVTAGTGLTGGGTSGAVTLAVDTTVVPTLGGGNTFSGANTFSQQVTFPETQYFSNQATGSDGADFYTSGNGLTGVSGGSNNGTGVDGLSEDPSEGEEGVFGGVFFVSNTFDSISSQFVAGVWGDTGNVHVGNPAYAAGVIGTGDDVTAGLFENNSSHPTVYALNNNSGGGTCPTCLFTTLMASTRTGTCGVGGNGDLTCTGQMKTLATTGGGARKVETYAMQSPENWMEDFGSGLLERGVAVVKIDPAFAETVSESADYHVFITPNGDSRGLYVIAKTPTSFEVRESGGGTSSLSFDYRIVAKRRGYETQRLVDVTEPFNAAMKAADRPMNSGAPRAARPASHLRSHPDVLPSQPMPGRPGQPGPAPLPPAHAVAGPQHPPAIWEKAIDQR